MAAALVAHGDPKNSQPQMPGTKVNGLVVLSPDTKIDINIGENLRISVFHSDILQDDADGIVISSDRNLNLSKTETGRATLRAGGSKIQDECRDYVNKYGAVEMTETVADTSAGNLKAKTLIHCCCPDYIGDCNSDSSMGNNMMQVTYGLCIEKAKNMDLNSLAFPSLGTDEFKIPPDVSAAAAGQALLDVIFSGGLGSLYEIRFVISNMKIAEIFSEELQKAAELFPNTIVCQAISPHSMPNDLSSSIPSTSNSSTLQNNSSKTEVKAESEEGGEDEISDAMQGSSYLRNGPLTRRQKRFDNDGDIAQKKAKEEDEKDTAGVSVPGEEEDASCSICMCDYEDTKTEKTRHLEKCGHKFHHDCIELAWVKMSPQCPICKTWYGVPKGDMPVGATMNHSIHGGAVPGFKGTNHIRIDYHIPGGIQTGEHPRPGFRFSGTSRTAFLPNTEEGKVALKLLKLAFKYRITFTVGDSHTSGQKDVVVWNCIHHKTSIGGGPQWYDLSDKSFL